MEGHMSKRVELVGLAEIAALAGVTRQAVANWRARYEDFPEPASELRSGPVWLLHDVQAWAKERGIALSDPAPEAASERRGQMAKTVALINMKGGVGKSTLTANLGWHCFYHRDKRVLLVDLDPQFNLSQYVMGPDRYESHLDAKKPTIVEVLEQGAPGIGLEPGDDKQITPKDVITTIREHPHHGSRLDLIPSYLRLAWTLKNPHSKEHLLRDFLEDLKEAYDLILIDCAPTESMLTDASYMASDYVLVPVRPEFLSTIGLPLLARSLKDFSTRYKKETVPEIAGIVFNHVANQAEHDRSRNFVKKIAKQEGWYVFENEVSFSNSYAAGARAGRPIFMTDYARYWKVAEFQKVAEEFISRISL